MSDVWHNYLDQQAARPTVRGGLWRLARQGRIGGWLGLALLPLARLLRRPTG